MSKPADDEQEWPLAPDPEQPPVGKYLVAYQRARMVSRFANRKTIELHFSIVEPGKWLNTVLVMYCSTPLDGFPGRNSKYVTMWNLANGGPGKRRDRMTPRIFEGYWYAEVDHTRRIMVKDGIRKLESNETGTAIIVELIERATGGGKK